MSNNIKRDLKVKLSSKQLRRVIVGWVCCGLSVSVYCGTAMAQPAPRRVTTPTATPSTAAPSSPSAPAAAVSPKTAEATPLIFAPAVSGICLFSRLSAIGAAKAGLAATIKMQQLANTIAAELNEQRAQIGSGSTSIAIMQQRLESFAQLEQIRGLQLQRTKALVENEISQAILPIIQAAITKNNCSVIFERNGSYGWNPAMDLTPLIVQELDDKLPALQFSLVPPEAITQ